jgi:hypothetical protein
MLDPFMRTLYERDSKERHDSKMVDLMTQLPNETLVKIASGEEKLGFGSDDDWLEKYKGTPLLDQAIQLEQQSLELEMQRKQVQRQEDEEYDQKDEVRKQRRQQEDELNVQKKMLDLELAKVEGEQMQAPEEPAAPPAPAEPQSAPTPPAVPQATPGATPPPVTPKVAAMKADLGKIAVMSQLDGWGRALARSDFDKTAQEPAAEQPSIHESWSSRWPDLDGRGTSCHLWYWWRSEWGWCGCGSWRGSWWGQGKTRRSRTWGRRRVSCRPRNLSSWHGSRCWSRRAEGEAAQGEGQEEDGSHRSRACCWWCWHESW